MKIPIFIGLRLMLIVTVIGLAFFVLSRPTLAISGISFNAGRIIDDAVFFTPSTLTTTQIQNFFNTKVPSCDTDGSLPSGHAGYATRADWGRANGAPPPYICLKNYEQPTPARPAESGLCGALAPSTKQTAAHIITNVSNACGINPKVIIVLLQKEQSLITDDWPWPIQYRSATGYGCPDTASCDEEYYGFFNQVYSAARQFKRYAASPNSFNYRPQRNSYIKYNPNISCGESSVFIENQATAGLYNYTPYQPNVAALNNLYGTGDSCSAYGNRNFWRLFHDWFGPTLVDIKRIRSDDGNPTQYVVYDGKKQGIPSLDVLEAWGLNRLTLETYTAEAISNIPSHETILSRYMKSSSTAQSYFIDDSGYFLADSNQLRNLWNFSDSPGVGSGKLFSILIYRGKISPYFKVGSSNTIYLVDDTQAFPFSSSTAFHAWRKNEPVINISSKYFNALTIAAPITHNRISFDDGDFLIVDGTKFSIVSEMNTAYPFSDSALPVTSALSSYFVSAGNLHRFIKSAYNGAVYLLNNGQLHGLPSAEMWKDYAGKGSTESTNLGYHPFDLIPQANVIRSTIVKRDSSNSYYVLSNGDIRLIPINLIDNYKADSHSFALDEFHYSSIGSSVGNVTPFVTSQENPAVFLLDNGKRYGISNPTTLRQLIKPGEIITNITNHDLNNYPKQLNITNYLSDGTDNYFIDLGKRYSVSDEGVNDWGLSAAQKTILTSGVIDHFTPSITPLTNYALIDSKSYLISSGTYFEASGNIWDLWNFKDLNPVSLSSNSLFRVKNGRQLNRFAGHNGTIYTIDNGTLIGITKLNVLFNLGYSTQSIVNLSDYLFSSLTISPSVFDDYLIKDNQNTCYVLDSGKKRRPIPVSESDWCFNINTSPTVSDNYLSLLPTGSQLTKSFRLVGNTTLYAIDDGTKRWIPNNNIYYTYFSPYSLTNKYLFNLLPTGPSVGLDGQ